MNSVVIVCTIIVLAVSYLFYKKSVEYVRTNSICLKQLWDINNRYRCEFRMFQSEEKYHKNCHSKQQYDNLNKENLIMAIVGENLDRYNKTMQDLNYNKRLYPAYEKQINEILSSNYNYEQLTRNSWINTYLFRQLELKEFEKDKLKPPLELIVEISVSYTSPQGRNHYRKHCTINSNNIAYYCNECIKAIEYKQSAQYQRSLMTDKLRYQVLNRDGHRCVICGASARDGVKLHVDHILPVSKGGKTELSNLRTLCERCNLGKGASYNPNGYN